MTISSLGKPGRDQGDDEQVQVSNVLSLAWVSALASGSRRPFSRKVPMTCRQAIDHFRIRTSYAWVQNEFSYAGFHTKLGATQPRVLVFVPRACGREESCSASKQDVCSCKIYGYYRMILRYRLCTYGLSALFLGTSDVTDCTAPVSVS